eukprot:scaffold15038_cov74-Phaeocystis_antarctica.AAC.6
MHSDVADGFVILISNMLRGIARGFKYGDDLQVCVEEDQRGGSIFAISDSIGPLSLLMHCASRESSVGKHRHRRQLIHRAVLSELVQWGGRVVVAANQESIVGERQAHEAPPEMPYGETAGPVGRQRLRVGIVARSDELHAT